MQDMQLLMRELQVVHAELLRKVPAEQARQVLLSSQTKQLFNMEPQLEQIFRFKKNPEKHLVQIDEELH